MSVSNFPNGSSLLSSSLTSEEMATVFQTLTAQILGYTMPPPNPTVGQQTYKAVRVGWQQTGQPAWKIDEDTCIITAYPEDDPFSRCRDQQNVYNDNVSVGQLMLFTQVWKIHWTCYGPNAYDHARLIVSAMSLDWVQDYLRNPPPMANTQICTIDSWDRPKWVPELFQGQWWPRADVDLRFNEKVLESTIVPTAASQTVIINTDTGQTETVVIN